MEPATTKNEKILGAGQILLAALLWSSAGLVIRGVSCDMFWLLVIRSGAACLVLAPGLGALRGRRFGLNAFLAALLYALFMVAFAVSTRVVGAAQAVGGQYTAPLFVYLALAVQRKLRVRLSGVLPMALIAAGCAVALVGGGLTPLTLLPLASGVLFPLYSQGGRRACRGGDVRGQPAVRAHQPAIYMGGGIAAALRCRAACPGGCAGKRIRLYGVCPGHPPGRRSGRRDAVPGRTRPEPGLGVAVPG